MTLLLLLLFLSAAIIVYSAINSLDLLFRQRSNSKGVFVYGFITTFLTFCLAFFAIFSLYSHVPEKLCVESAMVKQAIDSRMAADCFEFWLNRYQTLLTGTMIALIAGATYLVTRPQTVRENG